MTVDPRVTPPPATASEYMVVDERDVERLARASVNASQDRQVLTRVNMALEQRQVEVHEDIARGRLSLVFIAVAVVVCYVGMHVVRLRTTYAEAFAWYARVYSQGPRPLAGANFSMWCVCVSFEYNRLAGVLNGMLVCPAVSRAVAHFLLIMVQHFPHQIRGIEWAGSASQLRRDRLPDFISSYEKWSGADNAFRFLFSSPAAFHSSVAVTAAKRELEGSVLASLFTGGLCKVGVDHGSAGTSGTDLARDLLAQHVVLHRTCAAEKRARAINSGTQGMSIASSVGGVGSAAIGVGANLAAGGGAASIGSGLTGGVGVIGSVVSGEGVAATALCSGPQVVVGIFVVLGMALVTGVAVGLSVGLSGGCAGGDYYVVDASGKATEYKRGEGEVQSGTGDAAPGDDYSP